jgi:hypothetical protein
VLTLALQPEISFVARDYLPHVSEQQQNKIKMIASNLKANVSVLLTAVRKHHTTSTSLLLMRCLCTAKSGFNKNLLLWGKLVSFLSSHNKGYIVNNPIKRPLMDRNHLNTESEKKAVEINKFIY